MKTLGVLLIAACFVACSHSFPNVRNRDDDKENVDTVLVLPSNTRDQVMQGTSDFSDSSEDDYSMSIFRPTMVIKWPDMMRDFLNRWLWTPPSNIWPSATGLFNWDQIPEKANVTSTTKVVNGHVVTINETTYTSGDEESGTLIRVRVIDVRPQNDTLLMTEAESDAEVTNLPSVTTTARSNVATTSREDSTTSSRSVETVEEFDNEIPKNQVDTLTA